MIFVAGLGFGAGERFATCAVDRLKNQAVLRANLRDRALQDSGAGYPLAKFSCDLRGKPRIGWLAHHTQSLLNPLLRNKGQKG